MLLSCFKSISIQALPAGGGFLQYSERPRRDAAACRPGFWLNEINARFKITRIYAAAAEINKVPRKYMRLLPRSSSRQLNSLAAPRRTIIANGCSIYINSDISRASFKRFPLNDARNRKRKKTQGTSIIYMLSCFGYCARRKISPSIMVRARKPAKSSALFSRAGRILRASAPKIKKIGAKNRPFRV